jgi:RecA-family ATPase
MAGRRRRPKRGSYDIRSGLDAGQQRPLDTLPNRPVSSFFTRTAFTVDQTTRLLWYHDNDNELATPNWLAKKLLPEQVVALLSAKYSGGKTFMALHLAKCVARGEDFAARKIKRTGGTLFFAAEAAGDIPVRLRGVTADAQCITPQPPLPFSWVEDVPLVSQPGAYEQMLQDAREAAAVMKHKYNLPLALIIVDTMAAASGVADENDAAQTQVVMNAHVVPRP